MIPNLKYSILLACLFILGSVEEHSGQTNFVYESEQLKIEQLGDHTFRHISYLNTDDYGKVSCNGMIVVDDGESMVFDTPVTIEATVELIEWIEGKQGSEIKAVIPTHFHYDCLATLDLFHDRGITSYAHNKTIELAKSTSWPVPQKGFEGKISLPLGVNAVLVEFFGAGHTIDNVIAYYSPEQTLFGGCLVKGLGAGNGNLEDANVSKWPTTIGTIQETFPDAAVIIPGHGSPGDQALLTYTKKLFSSKQ